MALEDIATALHRVQDVFARRPAAAIGDDAPATATWQGGLRVVARHDQGTKLITDMPSEVGGLGEHVSPGWLMRAALSTCATTRIAMAAAEAGIALTVLEVDASSVSDACGLFGMPDEQGHPVPAAPLRVALAVRIAAPDVAPERLQALVQGTSTCSPVTASLEGALPVTMTVDVLQG
jgi:uncharacterized OsmC-like protein